MKKMHNPQQKSIGMHLAVLLIVACGVFASCGGKKAADIDLINNPNSAEGYDSKAAVPVLLFDSNKHDFGRLTPNESISYSFHFKNTGNADLIISGTDASCGCTVADYPHGRIAPGGDGYVTVTFGTRGKSGQQLHEVTVMSNAQPSRQVLRIMAMVGY